MGMLVEGRWTTKWYEPDAQGRFVRPETQFREQVGGSRFPVDTGRYHLYVSLACPWAHRTLIMRALKGLEDVISLSVVDPLMAEDGWRFREGPGCVPDTVNGRNFLHEIYTLAQPAYTGRVTVPVLWDKQERTIVNNESREILRMLDIEFDALARDATSYCPQTLRADIDATIDAIYEPINNGVYRAGFATTQAAYEEAVTELFAALDHWEEVLARQRYLCGTQLTEADWCLFTTLIRFDVVYYGHFKCNLRRLVDYPNLWNYVKELYQVPGVAATCNFNHIKDHYYRSHKSINPSGIVPKGPLFDPGAPYDRG